MNPEVPQSPLDYLNQIAPPMAKKTLFSDKRKLFIGLGGLVILAVIMMAVGSNLPKSVSQTERLAARLSAIQAVTESSTKNIKSSQLRTINSNLKLYFTNTIRDITPILTKSQIDIKKLSDSAKKLESNSATLTKLEDARLNAIYDRVYASEMSYQLDATISLMRQLSKATSDTSMKTFLAGAITNLEPTQKQFTDFDSANS